MVMIERHNTTQQSQRAFFGRRKGHPAQAAPAVLFDALLLRLALDLAKTGTCRSAHTVCNVSG